MKKTKPKAKTLKQLEEKYFGKPGTKKRKAYEKEIKALIEVVAIIKKRTRTK